MSILTDEQIEDLAVLLTYEIPADFELNIKGSIIGEVFKSLIEEWSECYGSFAPQKLSVFTEED